MKRLIRWALNHVPRPLLQRLAGWAVPVAGLFYVGRGRECPVCGARRRRFLPYGYVAPRADALCPSCLSLERHRLLWLYLTRETDLLRRPQVRYDDLRPFDPDAPALDAAVREQVEISVKYEGYIRRQTAQVEEFEKLERRRIPVDADYADIQGLRLEAREKLSAIRPQNLGQASRISGVSPADIAALMIWLHARGKDGEA